MAAASSTPNSAHGGTVCSGKHCERILGSGPFKGNLCQQCTAKIRSRRSGSSKVDAHDDTTPEGVSEKSPTSEPNMVGGSSPLAVLQGSDDLSLKRSSQDDDTTSKVAKSHLSQPTRPSFAIPYQTLAMSQNPSADTTADSNGLLAQHFNSRGEILEFARYGVAAEAPYNSGNIEQTRGGERIGQMQQCSRCNCFMPDYYSGEMCPACRVDMSIMLPRKTGFSNMIAPVNAQSIIPTSIIHVPSHATTDISAAPLTGIQGNMDGNGDMDIDNLELTYPAGLRPDQVGVSGAAKLDTHTDNIRSEAGSSRYPDLPGPLKRRKASHPEVVNRRRPSRSKSKSVVKDLSAPQFKDLKSTPFRSLKLCTTFNCTGVIAADSFATRCLNCVRSDWKSKRAKLSAAVTKIHTAATSNGMVKGEHEQGQTPSKRRKKRKSVTWADEISDTIMDENGLPDDPAISPRASVVYNEYAVLPLGTNLHHGSVDSQKSAPSEIKPSIQSIDDSLPVLPNGPNSPQKKLAPKVRLVVHPRTTDLIVDRSSPRRQQSETASSPRAPDSDQVTLSASSKEQEQIGWDSDLTELSDSVEDADSTCESAAESEATVDSPSKSSGLKIRIPARPAGAYTRKCASPRCNQMLAIQYRWKSCVMCRAQSRDYQRKRQNIQGRHTRLDLELLQTQNMGTPLAGELHKQDRLTEDKPVALVPGARLCSVRNCTFVIPPVDEYRWKMCALCRLRRREKNRRDSLNESNKDSGQQETSLIQQMINNLPLCHGSRPVGQCQSIDCGMLVVDSKSSQCMQCIARRIWLTGSNGNSSNVRGLTHGCQYIKKPRRSSPYPQFKCFATFLSEFKNRLSGFVRAQSVFFLFRHIKNAKALFAFDGEFSIVALDFDLIRRKEEVDSQAMKYKREIEHVGRIKFNPKRLISVLEGGGMAIRFVCLYSIPVLQATVNDNVTVIATVSKDMQCELEIANLPDDSHPFIPGQRTIIRFRLLG